MLCHNLGQQQVTLTAVQLMVVQLCANQERPALRWGINSPLTRELAADWLLKNVSKSRHAPWKSFHSRKQKCYRNTATGHVLFFDARQLKLDAQHAIGLRKYSEPVLSLIFLSRIVILARLRQRKCFRCDPSQ